MNPFMQATMIARCVLQERTQDHRTGRWTPWQNCGALPARLDQDGMSLCQRHWAQFWACGACHIVGQTRDDIQWSPIADVGLCAGCWGDVEEP